MFTNPAQAAAWLTETVMEFMKSPVNDLHMPGGHEPAYGMPLIGFASGSDLLWEAYKKEHVGDFHWTPVEAFALRYPEETVDASELSVMSWILPQTEATRNDQRKAGNLPSERWARARIFGEDFVNKGLRRHLLTKLEEKNVRAVAPHLLEAWKSVDSEKYVFASTWSERHAAYAAGLGTFGLCDGLITPAGKAMRAGSLVIRLELPATERPYTHHQEYCLYFSSGTCGVCMKRCPIDAITPEGHDKRRCRAYLREVTAPYVEDTWHFKGYGCGFCQIGVPCEKSIPRRPKVVKTAR